MSKQHDEITQQDITYIIDNPWELTASEWELHDEVIRKNSLSDIQNRLKLTEEDGYSKMWKTDNNKPIAILGGYRTGDKKYGTFFIASKHMEEHALKLSFDMRQILKEKSSEYRGYTLGLFSESEHPKQLTWFRFLGFKYKPDENSGNARYFEYTSKDI
jgi:hypothetical protein